MVQWKTYWGHTPHHSPYIHRMPCYKQQRSTCHEQPANGSLGLIYQRYCLREGLSSYIWRSVSWSLVSSKLTISPVYLDGHTKNFVIPHPCESILVVFEYCHSVIQGFSCLFNGGRRERQDMWYVGKGFTRAYSRSKVGREARSMLDAFATKIRNWPGNRTGLKFIPTDISVDCSCFSFGKRWSDVSFDWNLDEMVHNKVLLGEMAAIIGTLQK